SRPRAVLASAERVVVGCMQTLRDMGLKVPDDVALVGFSDNPLNHMLNPSLSCVRQPTFEIGQRSAELMIELIESKTPTESFKTIQLETFLDIMESSKRVN